VKQFATFCACVNSYWPRNTAPTIPGEKGEGRYVVFRIIEFIITIMDGHHFRFFFLLDVKEKNKFDIVGNFKRNSLCSNIKKFSKCEVVMSH